MNGHAFFFAGVRLTALPSGALWWPAERLLCVSDLHLGKAERLARRGGTLLPPYETQATLARLEADLEATGAERVLCLGDSFDDGAAADGLAEPERLWLRRLMTGRDWIWILGNHDPAPTACGGSHRATAVLGPLTFRHIAEGEAEVSGHYHPKCALAGRARPCFLPRRAAADPAGLRRLYRRALVPRSRTGGADAARRPRDPDRRQGDPAADAAARLRRGRAPPASRGERG